MLTWPGSFPAPSQAPALCCSFRGRARCALTLRPPCSTAFHRRGLEVPSGASASARRFWPQERTHRNPRGKGVRGRPLAAGREGAHPGSGRSEDAAGPCLARTRSEHGSKREQRTRPSLPPPRPPLGTPPRCPPRAGGRQGGGALGRAVPAARCPLASGLRGLSVSSRSSRAFCLPEPALPDEPGAGCTTCGLLPIRPLGLKICDARKLTKFSTGHFTPHENPPHYQTRIPPWVTRAVSARRCRPGLG